MDATHTLYRSVARDKSVHRHHSFRGVRGHAPSGNFDILYLRSCILEHFKAYFEGYFYYMLQRLPRLKIYSFLNVNSPHKNKVKIIENLPFCIQDIFITWA